MNQIPAEIGGGIFLFVVIFLVILVILWFLLPFAIFGTKAKLDTLIQEMRKANTQLEKLREQFATSTQPNPPGTPDEPILSHDHLMAKYKISNDGEKYIFQGHRYDKIEDAIEYARNQARR